MKRSLLFWVFVSWASVCLAVVPNKKKDPKLAANVTRASVDTWEPPFPRLQYNHYMGAAVLKGTALDTGAQFGVAPVAGIPLYIGPELHFFLYSSGGLLSCLASAWYEMRISRKPDLSLALGAAGGVAINRQLAYFEQAASAVLVNAALLYALDDLVSLRGDIHSGYIASYLTFLGDIAISFRFP